MCRNLSGGFGGSYIMYVFCFCVVFVFDLVFVIFFSLSHLNRTYKRRIIKIEKKRRLISGTLYKKCKKNRTLRFSK